MNRRHKKYASVLGLAVVALVADRLFLAPDEAHAGAPPQVESIPGGSPVTASTAALAAARQGAATPSLEASVAARLEAIARERVLATDFVPNAFRLPEAWGGGERPLVHEHSSSFAAVHELQAALANGADSMAIIDGRTVRLGQVFDGMTLEQVRKRSVVFSSPSGERIELPIK